MAGPAVRSRLEHESGLELVRRDSTTPTAVPATASAVAANRKPQSFHLSFLALNIMVFIVSLDATTLAVAISTIARQLKGTTLESLWASSCFMLATVVTQPLYTSCSDVLGRKPPLYFACLVFFVGSIVFAVSENMSIVILGRFLQGLGGGGLDVLQEVIVVDMTTLKERPLYLGLLAVPMAAGGILGPPVGALFSQFVSWRWIGWFNLPLTAVAFILSLCFLRLRPLEDSWRDKLLRLDWNGMLLFAVGSTAFSLPLSWAGSMYSWSSWRTLLPLIVGLFVLIVFMFYESLPAQPVVPHRLLRSATARATLFGGFVHGMIVYCLMQYLPLFFQAVLLETALGSVVSFLPLCITTVVFSCVSAIIVDRYRKYLWNIWLGWVLMTLGVGLLFLFGPAVSLAARISIQILAGIGIGTLYCILILPLQASVSDVDDVGLASGLLVFFRLFGALFGLAISSAIFDSAFQRGISTVGDLPDDLAGLAGSNQAIMLIPELRTVGQGLPPEVLADIVHVYLSSFRGVWLALTIASSLGLALSLWAKELSMEQEEVGRQHFE